MTLAELLASIPKGVNKERFLAAEVKTMWRNHLEDLRILRDLKNPLRPDAIQNLINTQALAAEIKAGGYTINSVADGYVNLMARLDVNRELAIGKLESGAPMVSRVSTNLNRMNQ